jgi:Concanavalin A-like lectin/glucanases superfamily/Secretion system C-terminal sorting domain/Glycine rich protein
MNVPQYTLINQLTHNPNPFIHPPKTYVHPPHPKILKAGGYFHITFKTMFMKKVLALLAMFLVLFIAKTQAQGNTLNFDGVDDYVDVPHNAAYNVSAITIEAWILWNPTLNTDVQFITSKGAENAEIHLGATANTLRFIPTTGVYLDVAGAIPTGRWIHIACMYNPSNAANTKIYINGVDMAYTNNGGNPLTTAIANNSTNYRIGARANNSFYFKGSIDEIRIFNTTRTATEVAADMRNTTPTNAGSLVAQYNFNTGLAGNNNAGLTTLTDASSTLNNGTAVNFSLSGNNSNWLTSYAMVVPAATAATAVSATGFTANWNTTTVGTLTNYFLDVSSSANFSSFVSGYNGLSVSGTSTTITVPTAGLYYYRLRGNIGAPNAQLAYSNVVTVSATAPVSGNVTFNYTGSSAIYTVPAGVTSLLVKVYGAAGANAISTPLTGGTGGKGAFVQGTLTVTPGDVLNINVGGTNGYNGGGAAGTGAGNGGGASDIRMGGNNLSNRVVVAGGGGGGGRSGFFGTGISGTPVGGNGGNSNTAGVAGGSWTGFAFGFLPTENYGGGGGAVGSGGVAGWGCTSHPAGAGSAGGGGGMANASIPNGSLPHGGGGGGGYILGGGGGAGGYAGAADCADNSSTGGGGGAGGSNYTTGLTGVSVTDGFQSGDGKVEIIASTDPVISLTGTLTSFTSCLNTASAQQNFSASGSFLTTNLVITAPTGYEVSTTSGTGFASSVSLTPTSGTVTLTTIYVRLSATATAGTQNANVTATSTGATTQTLALVGIVNSLPTVTPSSNSPICVGGAINLGSTVNTTYAWAGPNGFSSALQNPSISTATLAAGGTYNLTLTNSNGCSASASTTVVVNAPTWNGTDWTTPCLLPNSNTMDVTIASSVAPASFTARNVTINSGVSLNTTGITATVNGGIINNGNGVSGTGTVMIASNSTLSGSMLNFSGTLTVSNGAVLNTANLLTLSSTAAGTARIAAGAAAGGYITGNVTVQRFIAGGAGRRKFRFIGHPFSAAMNITELTDDVDITGAITGSNANNFTATTTSNPSAFIYNESTGNGAGNDPGWTALTSGNAISTIAPGQGLRLLIRGSKGQSNIFTSTPPAPANVTLSMTGQLRQGNFTQNLSYTSVNQGWNLISNPYPSSINWNTVRANIINVNDAIYTYRPSLSGGTYGTYINGSSSNGGSQFVEAYAAFFVRASDFGASIDWLETNKVANNPGNSVFRTAANINNRISLTLTNDSTQNTDEVVVRFGDDPATDLFDAKYDAYNMAGAAQDLYVLDKQQNKYSIYHGSALGSNQTEKRVIAMGIDNLIAGSYTIATQTLNAFANGNKLYLHDAQTDVLTEVTNHNLYKFTVAANSTNVANRFTLVFNAKASAALPIITTLSLQLSPNPARGLVQLSYSQTEALNSIVTITNALGKQVKNINLGKVQTGISAIDVSTLSAGTYFVQWNNGVETKTQKLVIQ